MNQVLAPTFKRMIETYVRHFVIDVDAVSHQLTVKCVSNEQRKAFLRERNALSCHAANYNYMLHWRPIWGEYWDFKPPNTSNDSNEDELDDNSDDKDEQPRPSDDNNSSSMAPPPPPPCPHCPRLLGT